MALGKSASAFNFKIIIAKLMEDMNLRGMIGSNTLKFGIKRLKNVCEHICKFCLIYLCILHCQMNQLSLIGKTENLYVVFLLTETVFST